MISTFSRAIDHQVDRQFRKDPNGRLAFLPFGPKGKAFFVNAKSDEEKIRALVKMYRGSCTRISWLVTPCIYVGSSVLNVYGSATPLRTKVTASIAISSLVMTLFLVVIWMLWNAYKEAIPGLTASLTEVGPDLRSQLSELPSSPQTGRRVALVCFGAAIIVLVGVALVALTHRSSGKVVCPPRLSSTLR